MKSRVFVAIATAVLLIAVTGCSEVRVRAPFERVGAQAAVDPASPDARDETIARQKREIAELERELADSKTEAASAAAADDGEQLPPNARPGECYARVLVPAGYKTESVQVVKRPASERIEVEPARFEKVAKKVLVQEASEKIEVVPATYEWVDERVEVSPASTKVEQVPARYAWAEEKVMVKPAQNVWKKGRGPIERVDNATGEIMCLVEEPAVYETVRKKVVVEPAGVRTIEVPAKYEIVRKRVVKEEASTRKVKIPAEYKTIVVTEEVSPAKKTAVPIPAEYETITKKVKLSEERIAWRSVLCHTNAKGKVIERLQTALNRRGYDAGPADGQLGNQTMRAVQRFQRAEGLPTGGLTMSTFDRLGIDPRT